MTDEAASLFIRKPRRTWTSAGVIFLTATFSAHAENLPEIRPALIGSHPNALVNLIDTKKVMQSGLTHGAVLFDAQVTPAGTCHNFDVYGGTAGTDALRQKIKIKIPRAIYIPAIFNHHNTYAWIDGTVTFSVLEGKPHLRIYLNQERSELVEGHDFIAPQTVYVTGHRYDHIKYPAGTWEYEQRPATFEVEMTVDATGKLLAVHASRDTADGKKYGDHAEKRLRNMTFLPAFRNGRQVESTTHFTYLMVPSNMQWILI
jgi:hypothetical protein